MYKANLGQILRLNHDGHPWDAWVLHLAQGAAKKKDQEIRDRHRDVEPLLSDQNVSFIEITTEAGKQGFYERFGCTAARHPIFVVLSRHPNDYATDNLFLIIEWGDLSDADAVGEDLMTFAQFFSKGELRDVLADARTFEDWSKLAGFLGRHDFRHLKVGQNVQIKRFPPTHGQ